MAVGTLTGYPSFARSLIAATIYCCSRREPMRPMEVQFGLRIEYWLLPYVNLIIDCLQVRYEQLMTNMCQMFFVPYLSIFTS